MIFKTFLIIFLTALATGNELKNNITIDNLQILKASYVHMNNESAVLDKINGIVKQGADELQFITDFDQTITKQYENGAPTLHSAGVFFRSKLLPESALKKINAALSTFHSIDFNHTIDTERKKQITNGLSGIAHKNLQGIQFDKQEIERVSRKYGPSLRNRTDELFSKLKNLQIPVVIFSAGLRDVIEEQLRQQNLLYDNLHIISNRLKLDGSVLNGFQNYENGINAFNKDEHLSRYVNSENLKIRKNIILMGDHPSDATVVQGIKNIGIILKIGFFYNQAEESLTLYKEKFDIVLNDDQTMNMILAIIKLL